MQLEGAVLAGESRLKGQAAEVEALRAANKELEGQLAAAQVPVLSCHVPRRGSALRVLCTLDYVLPHGAQHHRRCMAQQQAVGVPTSPAPLLLANFSVPGRRHSSTAQHSSTRSTRSGSSQALAPLPVCCCGVLGMHGHSAPGQAQLEGSASLYPAGPMCRR